MIVQYILSAISAVIRFAFSILPNLPQAPTWLETTLDAFVSTIVSGIGIVSYIITPQIFIFVCLTSLLIINFEYVYHLVLWVIKKLPIGSH